jgi:hypothetical protein
MDTKLFEEYQASLMDWQKKFYDTWVDSLPNGKANVDLSENFEKAIKFQEELVKAYLESQEKATEMMLETQKKFWDQYFVTARKQTVAASN